MPCISTSAPRRASLRSEAEQSDVVERLKAARSKARAAHKESIQAARIVLGAARLTAYCAVGRRAMRGLQCAFDVMLLECERDDCDSKWRPSDCDAWANQWALDVREMYPGLVQAPRQSSQDAARRARKLSDSQIRVMDWIRVAQAVELLRPIVGDVLESELSYETIYSRIVPLISFDKRTLEVEWKGSPAAVGWPEFLRVRLAALMREEITVGQFYLAYQQHEARLDAERQAQEDFGKQQSQIDAERGTRERAERARAASRLVETCNTQITTGLTNALSGAMPVERLRGIVEQVQRDTGRTIFPTVRADPATFTGNDFRRLLGGLYTAQRLDVLDEIVEIAQEYAARRVALAVG